MKIKKNINEYTFLDHLEELRWRIIKIMIAFVLLLIASLFFVPTIFTIIKMPIKNIDINLNVFSFQGYFIAYLKIGVISSIILTFPIILYQLSAFILPGLHTKERKYFYITILFSILFFLVGITFSYIILTPTSFNFLYNFATSSEGFNLIASNSSNNINILPGLNEYIDLFILLIFLTGVTFQLPLIIMFLTLIGLIDDKLLKKYRPYIFIIILVLSAILTPPDILTQVILGIPLYLLFELSIIISKVARIRKKKKETELYQENKTDYKGA